jgi:hypothetical protein
VPDTAVPTTIDVKLVASSGQILAETKQPWKPQRKWKVYIVESSHEDLGYEDYIFKKQHENANWIDIARRLSNPKVPMGGGRYHYTMETLIAMRNYIDERSEQTWRNLVDTQIKTGEMALMGAPSGVHSHWMDYEELARMTYPARREVADRFGLDLKTFMIVDNPSLSWSGAEVLADAGFRYVARWGQSWRSGGNNDYAHTKVPAIFWWLAPDQVHKLLFTWRTHYGLSFWYGQAESGYANYIDIASLNVNRQLQAIQSGSELGPYPYDAVIYPSYVDHAIPHVSERALPQWSKAYAYPEIHVDSPTKFFEYMEKRYGDTFPVLSGDLNNFSADYATIDPESQGWKRNAARTLPVAEGLNAICSYLGSLRRPIVAKAEQIWTQIYDYDEHSWPTQPPAKDMHLFNASWVKKQGAKRALNATDALLAEGAKALVSQIPGNGQRVIVFNSLAHVRDGVVNLKVACSALKDLSNDQTTPCETTGPGKSVFIARQVPAYGYKVYRMVPKGAVRKTGLSATNREIGNQFYDIRFDSRTGNVVSIRDKRTGRELVDSQAKHQFNQLVYVHKDGRESKEGFEYSPSAAGRMESHAGPIQVTFETWTNDAKTGAAIHQTVILYDGLPRIDIVNDLQHASIMYSNNYADRYKENIFYAFPIAVPEGQPRAEYPGGVVRPYLDQLRWGSHDYLSANHWVDVSNRNFGVTIAPWNEGIFDFGEIRYNQFSIDYKPVKPYLFSYAWSNRMAGLLTLNGQECNATFRYSVQSHQGDWNEGATTAFGWSVANPLLAEVVSSNSTGTMNPKAKSFLNVDAPNVQLTVLKKSDQPGRGWIARFVETSGKGADFTLQSNLLPVKEAFECDLVENDRSRLNVDGSKLRVKILPFGFATVRLIGGEAAGVTSNVTATAVSGERVSINWNPSGNASYYHIFRSMDPKAPPTAYTLIAEATKAPFHDDGLTPGTVYYYRVAGVSRENIQGEVSPQVSLKTGPLNTEPPAPINGLSIVRLAKDRLMICWNKSADPDTARYYLYRGSRNGFSIKQAKPVAELNPSGYFLETFVDRNLLPAHTYYYRVVAEDWAGNRQTRSATVNATTPAE